MKVALPVQEEWSTAMAGLLEPAYLDGGSGLC